MKWMKFGVAVMVLMAGLLVPAAVFADDGAGDHVHVRELKSLKVSSYKAGEIPYCGNFTCSECGRSFQDSVTPEDLGMPIVDIVGSIEDITKNSTASVVIRYMARDQSFDTNATIKLQGASSLLYPKQNYSIHLLKDDGKKNKVKLVDSWGKQSKYCLKANYIDYSQARNVVSAKIFNDVVHSRDKEDELSALPNGGVIDGFPVVLYYNGAFLGLYTLNIPKDKWMFGMSDETIRQAVLFGERWSDSVELRMTIDDVENVQRSGWDMEYCSTEDDETVGTAWAAESMNIFIRFLKRVSDERFKRDINIYTDVDRAIDVMLYTYFIHASDNTSKNILWATFDGTRWIPSVYDLDGTWGMNSMGKVDHAPQGYVPGGGNLLFERLLECYPEEIKTRYHELRKSALSEHNILEKFCGFNDSIHSTAFAADAMKWRDQPSVKTSSYEQIADWAKQRIQYMDAYYGFDPKKENEPVTIDSYDDLAAFIAGINDGSIDPKTGAVLVRDIKVPEEVGNSWVPLGKDLEHEYNGSLDGNEHKITGIRIDRSEEYPDVWKEGVAVNSYTALVSFLGEEGIVSNLDVEADIKDVNCVAGIVSQNKGTISNCTFKGTLESNIYPNSGSAESYLYPGGVIDEASGESGGIAALNMGNIYECKTLNGTRIYHGGVHCGGIAGMQVEGGTITMCTNYADVSVDATSYPTEAVFVGGAGGIAGGQAFSMFYGTEYQAEMIVMAESTGKYESRKDLIVSMLDSRIKEPVLFGKQFDPADLPVIWGCDNYGKVICESLTGGICGQSYTGSIETCSNYGLVDGITRMWGGGIAGYVGTDPRLRGDNSSSIMGNTNYSDINTSTFDSGAGLDGCGMYQGSYIGGVAGQIEDYYNFKTGIRAYINFSQNVNRGSTVAGRFGVGGVVGYLTNAVYTESPDDPEGQQVRKAYVYELVNVGNVEGSDCVGGVAGACPGALTDSVNYGNVTIRPANKDGDLFYAGGVAGSLSTTGVCASSYSVGRVSSKVLIGCGTFDPVVMGGVTGAAVSDAQVPGTFYCYEKAPHAYGAVGSWEGEHNFGYVHLSEMGGGAAEVSMIQLFDGSTSLQPGVIWETAENVEDGDKTYYMTPQLSFAPLTFQELDAAGLMETYPFDVSSARVTTQSAVYNGTEQNPDIHVFVGGVELPEDQYEITDQSYKNCIKAGDYYFTVVIKADPKYTGTIEKNKYTIAKAKQKIKSVKPETKTVRASKKTRTFKLTAKVTPAAGHGKITYKKTKGNKNITVTKSGKVTVKKGQKPGTTYKLKVKVTAAETKNYKAAKKTKTITITIK